MATSEITEPILLDSTGQEMVAALRSIRNAISGNAGTIYGFYINGHESDPDSMVTYLADAVGMVPAHMDFDNDVFDYGSWENAFFMPRPCMVKYDGTVDYYLDPNDFTKKSDGVTASDVANTAYPGNAMMEWGRDGKKIWWKIEPSSDKKSAAVYIADYRADADFHDWNFHNCNGASVDHFYRRIYNGSLVEETVNETTVSRLRSLSGQQVMNKKTAPQERTYAQANNPSTDAMWDVETFVDILLINLLLILIGKSTDTQAVFGQGLNSGGNEANNNNFRTGVHNAKGLFYGTNSGAETSSSFGNAVKIFGTENHYGFQWQRLIGWINSRGTQKAKLTYGQEDGSTVDGYNLTGDGYLSIGATPSGTSGGCTSEMEFSDKGMFPKVVSGSDSTYYADGLWFDNSDVSVARVGGGSGNWARVGAFCVRLNNAASSSDWGFGASLSCKPLA